MEENTSKAYVEPSGLVAGSLPATETGSPLFLINLCASMAPVQLASKSLPGFEAYRLYQVTRVEDGRTRYRLRLGFFPTQAEADEILAKVREQYPTAFTACLCEEDRRHTRGYVVSAAATKPAMTIVASNPPKAAPVNSATAARPAATVRPAAAAKTPPAPSLPVSQKPAAPVPAVAPATATKSKPAPAAQVIEIARQPAAAAPNPMPAKEAPTAKTSTLEDELKGLESLSWDPPALTPSASAAKQTTGKHPAQTVPAGFKSQPVIKATTPPTPAREPSGKPSATPSIKIDAGASMRVKALELTLSDPPPAPTPKSAPAVSNEPFHVGKGIEIPAVQLSLQADTPTATKAQPTAPAAKAPAAKSAPSVTAKAPPKASAVQAKTPPAPTKPAPVPKTSLPKNSDLDSTQTIRALTNEELADEAQEKWFAIQLAASEQPVNLDAMPHLDIFEAYRLYSIATAGSGKIIHSLRLGFFKEAVSAEAVAGYLKTFFGSPSVLRISLAEQARFKDATMPKKPAVPEPKAPQNVVEISSVRTPRPAVPTVTMEVVDPAATGSFRMNSTGSFRTSDTAKHRTLTTPGAKPAAKSAAPAVKRAPPTPKKASTTGKYKIPSKKSLAEQLLDEAKEVELSESGIYKMPKNDSLLSRLVDKLKK